MKVTKVLGDVAVTVGCCVGVGFISGKEMQVFFGNKVNVALFAVTFFAVNLLVREYCRTNGCTAANKLASCLFNKGAAVFNVALSVCCFVCIVTMLAGVEQCLSSIVFVSKAPLYAFFAAVIAALLLGKGIKALKIANILSVILAVILLVVLLCTRKTNAIEKLDVPLYNPMLYALFSLTMSLGVVTQLACESTKKENLLSSALSSIGVAALMLLVLPACDFNESLPTIGGITNPLLLAFAVVTMLLAAVTGIVANAYPILQLLYPIESDKTLWCTLIFGFALTLSLFGFDFAVKFGYALVAAVGIITVLLVVMKLVTNKKKQKLKLE